MSRSHSMGWVGIAETRFALARALWEAPIDTGRDRPRAREQAELARTAYAKGDAQFAEDLAAVETWLAKHAG